MINPYVVVGNDIFSKMLADDLGVKHVKCGYGHYPHEDLFWIDPEVEYDELNEAYAILVSRFKQPYTQGHSSELSHLTLGMLALVYNLSESYNVRNCDSFQPCLLANKQDHDPRTDESEKVRHGDKGKVPLLNFLLDGVYPARTVTYNGHRPDLRCGNGIVQSHGYSVVPLSLIGSITKRLNQLYPELSNSSEVYIVSPDKKITDFSKAFAESLGTPNFATLDVSRTGPSKSVLSDAINADGKHIIIADDTTHTFSAGQAVIDAIKNPKSVTLVSIHCPITELGWQRLQEILTNDYGFPVRYFTTPTVQLSPEFENHPMIDVLDLESVVSVAADFYKSQFT